jgi:hypothetical protein
MIDLNNGKSREYLRRAVARGWPVPQEYMDEAAADLRILMAKAAEEGNSRAFNSCLRNLIAMNAQNQADEHLAIRGGQLQDQRITVVYADKAAVQDDQ